MADPAQDVTLLLQRLAQGDNAASDQLLPQVYTQLHRIAQSRMRLERRDHTLQATALVSEAWLQLLGSSAGQFKDRRHFFAVAALAMRRVLVDHARARKAEKRGGPTNARVPLTSVDLAIDSDPDEILALDDALSRLELQEPEVAKVVHLRFFVGLSGDETAKALEISPRQVDRLWSYAKAFLAREIGRDAT